MFIVPVLSNKSLKLNLADSIKTEIGTAKTVMEQQQCQQDKLSLILLRGPRPTGVI